MVAWQDWWEPRDRYLKRQQSEKIETEVRDVDRDTNHVSVRMLSRVAFWGVMRAYQSNIKI
jgi:hypothetical protein